MNGIWDPHTYDSERCRLVPCFDAFYGTAVELTARTAGPNPRILDLGAGTGLLSALLTERIQPANLLLVDASAEMLERAQERLADWSPRINVQRLTDPLPDGPYDAVVSALAIHHLTDSEKRDLFERVLNELGPGGIFVNAEQVRGETDFEERLFSNTHLDSARGLGSSEQEIAGAVGRMRHDRCAPLSAQLNWLREHGYEHAACFFQWFRFAVYAGWKPG